MGALCCGAGRGRVLRWGGFVFVVCLGTESIVLRVPLLLLKGEKERGL